jgi:hypothetical protein
MKKNKNKKRAVGNQFGPSREVAPAQYRLTPKGYAPSLSPLADRVAPPIGALFYL